MPYVIETSSGDPIIVPDGGLNQDYSIDLVGRNYENFGEVIAKTQIDLLNNFATNSVVPARPTAGQLWYDKTSKQIRVYDSSTGAWLPTRALISAAAPTNTYGQNKPGTTYFNTSSGQLYVHDGAAGYRLANAPGEISTSFNTVTELESPAFYGSSLRNIFLTDTTGVKRAVLALFYRNDGENPGAGNFQGEKIIAVVSGHAAAFTVADAFSTTETVEHNFYAQFNEPNGIGLVIKPGINNRVDNEAIANESRLALRASTSYNLNTGSYTLLPDGTIDDNGGANIAASTVYHQGINAIPAVTNTYTLGNASTIFSEVYSKDIYVGEDGGTGSILPNNSTITIGSALNEVSEH